MTWSYCSHTQRLEHRSGVADQRRERIGERHRRLHVRGLDRGALGRLGERTVVDRRLVAELLDRQVGHHGVGVLDDEALARRGVADDREVEPPLAEDRLGLLLLLGLEHHEHALLALRQHHLVGAHAGLAARHPVEFEVDAEIALGAHLDRRAGEPGGAHVLDGDDAALGHDLQAGFEQELLGERIADLHGRALLLGALAELGRSHAGAVDAVAAGLGAEIDDRHADARGRRVENLVGVGEAHRHGIDQAIAVVARMEADRAADRRHAEANCRSRRCRPPRRTPDAGSWDAQARRSDRKLRQAIGRAPMVNTSRRMPPTPVAAPW